MIGKGPFNITILRHSSTSASLLWPIVTALYQQSFPGLSRDVR